MSNEKKEWRDVRDAHIERLRTWNIPVSERYADDVVRRAFASPGLRSHEHAHREMGMCLECDAAEAVRSLDPESNLLAGVRGGMTDEEEYPIYECRYAYCDFRTHDETEECHEHFKGLSAEARAVHYGMIRRK